MEGNGGHVEAMRLVMATWKKNASMWPRGIRRCRYPHRMYAQCSLINAATICMMYLCCTHRLSSSRHLSSLRFTPLIDHLI